MTLGPLAELVERLSASGATPCPWDFGELHNPWGRAARNVDAWAILDLCQSRQFTDPVTDVLGPDLILFDTELFPNPWSDGSSAFGSERFPVAPRAGATLLYSLETIELTIADDEKIIELAPGRALVIDAATSFRVLTTSGRPALFMARYFPSTSLYLRDEAAPEHQLLTDLLPLFNQARAPLWQVAGEDRADNDFVTGFNQQPGHWLE